MTPRPTAAGAVVAATALAAAVGGVLGGLRDLVAVGAGLAAALLAGAAAVAGRAPRVERGWPAPRVTEGSAPRQQLTMHDPPRRRWYRPPLHLHDRVAGRAVPITWPDDRAITVVDLPPLPRGRHVVGPLTVWRQDPLGLVRGRATTSGTATVWVHPAIHALRPPVDGGPDDHDRHGPVARGRPGSSFHGVREHEPSDDVRLIHWPTTARAGTAMVREVLVADDPAVLVVLDTAAATYGGTAAFDDAVRVAASVAAAALGQGLAVWLRTTSGHHRSVPATAAGLRQLLDDLAEAVADAGDGAVSAAVLEPDGAGTLVAVTGAPDGGRLRALVEAAGRFDAVTLVTVGPDDARAVPGVRTIAGPTSAAVAARWNRWSPG